MPLPKPKKNEKRKDFINRCVNDINIKNEFKNINQRIAVCNSQWRKNKK